MKTSFVYNYGPDQYGFRPNSSTLFCTYNNIHDFITRYLDNVETVGILLIAFDVKKAFDSLPHQALLQTLSKRSLPSTFIRCVYSYLKDRKKVVTIIRVSSSSTDSVTSGVP